MNLDDIKRNYRIFKDRYYAYDKKIMEIPPKKYEALSDLHKNICQGRFFINLMEYHFECFFHNHLSEPPKFLYVFYDAARTPIKENNKPVFPRWTYFSVIESLGGALLCIEDPMVYKYTDLRLGWYYGTQEESVLALSLEIVKTVSSNLHISPENIVFFGSSGAGYTGIYASSMLEGSLAIAINPQIYIQYYAYAKKFEEITGFDLSKDDSLHRNNLPYLMKKSRSSFCVLFNMEEISDINNHAIPLCESYGIFPEYGIKNKDNLMLWLYHAKGAPHAHNSVETRSIFCGIDFIAKSFHQKKERDMFSLKKLGMLINECWHDIYDFKASAVGLKKQLTDKECMSLLGSSLECLPVRLGGNDIAEQLIGIELPASDKAYNTYYYDRFQENMMYEILLNVKADYPVYAIGLLDRTYGKTLMYQSHSTKKRLVYRCITGNHVEGLCFVIHAGLAGHSKGKSLLIQNLTVLARPLNCLSVTEKKKDFNRNDVHWYDIACDTLTNSHWIRFKNISFYDHHVMPWRELIEISCILNQNHSTNLLELGLSESSKLLAQYVDATGANHMIIDEDKDWSLSFLRKHPELFHNTKVHIAPLLDAEKDDHRYCAFSNFTKIISYSKFHVIIQHRPRGGGQTSSHGYWADASRYSRREFRHSYRTCRSTRGTIILA